MSEHDRSKWRLNDTTSDGIRFLLIGVGSLFLLRLVHGGIVLLIRSSFTTDLSACIAEFSNGYLIADPTTLIIGGAGLGERLALALVLSVGCAVLAALVVASVAKASGRAPLPQAVPVARLALVVTGLWWCYAAMMVPPRMVRLDTEGLVLTERIALVGDLCLPGNSSNTLVPWTHLERIEVRTVGTPMSGMTSMHQVEAVGAEERIVLASVQADGPEKQRNAERTQRLARLVQAAYLVR